MTICIKTKVCGAIISLEQNGIDDFAVTYEKHNRKGLTYSKAAQEYGACVMHALACNGRLDNREEGEI